MQDLSSTQYFKVEKAPELKIGECSGNRIQSDGRERIQSDQSDRGIHYVRDPTYITSYMNARSLIMKVERDELVEEVMKDYVSKHGWD